MIDVALISSVISAEASGVALFDKIADQVERFISKKPEEDSLERRGSNSGIPGVTPSQTKLQ